MSEANAVNPTTLSANAQPAVDEAVEVKTPTKRTPKRKADAFQKESEELLKTLGVSVDMEDGRRRTRSSARGGGVVATPVTPATPPAKRARGTTTTPKRGQEAEAATTPNSKTATPKKRGHVEPKNLMKSHEPEEEPQESVVDSTDSAAEAAKMDTAKQPEPSVVVKADKPPQSDGVDTVEKVVPQQDGDKKELAASETKQSTAEVEPTPDRKVEERSSAQKPAVEEVQTKEEDKTTKNDVQSKAVDAGASQTDGAPVEEKMDVDVVSGDKSSEAANDAPQANVSKTTPEAETEPKKPTVEVSSEKEASVAAANETNGNSTPKAAPEEAKVVAPVKEVGSEPTEAKKESPSGEVDVNDAPKEAEKETLTNKVEPVKCTTENSVDTAVTANSVTEKVSSNVEPKIVSNEAATVESAP